MWHASRSTRPSLLVFDTRSLPARSTRLTLLVCMQNQVGSRKGVSLQGSDDMFDLILKRLQHVWLAVSRCHNCDLCIRDVRHAPVSSD